MRARTTIGPVLAAALVPVVLLAARSPAADATALSEAQQRGKSIYTKGVGRGPIHAKLVGPDLVVEAAQFPCVGCHGEDGGGRLEGGVRTADIRPERLAVPADAARDFGRTRPPYIKEAQLARAIRDRLDPAGNPLHPGMPAYVLGEPDLADLLAYLAVLGDEAQPGVTATSVRVATLVPKGGPLAQVATFTSQVIRAAAARINEEGGVFGRTIEIAEIPYDAAEPHGAATALAEALDRDPPFCMVASFGLDDDDRAASLLAERAVPVIAPLGLPADDSYRGARNTFYLYSSIADQARVLVDYLANDLARPDAHVAVVYADDRLGNGGAAGVAAQAAGYDMVVDAKIAYSPGRLEVDQVTSALENEEDAVVFFFGPGSDAVRLLGGQAKNGRVPTVLASAETIGAAALALPEAIRERLYLASPVASPDLSTPGMRRFLALAEANDIEGRYKAFQLAAYAGMELVREGLRKSGRGLTRSTFSEALMTLWRFETGVVPAVTYDENRRVGLAGAQVVRADSAGKGFVAAAPWREPLH